jgi:hypothetical protein
MFRTRFSALLSRSVPAVLLAVGLAVASIPPEGIDPAAIEAAAGRPAPGCPFPGRVQSARHGPGEWHRTPVTEAEAEPDHRTSRASPLPLHSPAHPPGWAVGVHGADLNPAINPDTAATSHTRTRPRASG